MNDNIINFPCLNSEDIPVDRLLEQALSENLESVLLIGKYKNGDYFLSSSDVDVKNILWLIEVLKREIMEYEP